MPLTNRDRQVAAAALRKAARKLDGEGSRAAHHHGKGTLEKVGAQRESAMFREAARKLREWADKLK